MGTGACYHAASREYWCAVSEDGCDAQSTFISARDLDPNVECFLSRNLGIPDETGKSGYVGLAGSASNRASNRGGKAIGGGVLVGVLVVCAMVGFFVRRRRRDTGIEATNEVSG